MLNLDFYTIKTSVDLTDNDNINKIQQVLGLFCRPDIISKKPKKVKGEYAWRFAIRSLGLYNNEQEFISSLPEPFSVDNTKLIKADDL